MTLFVDSKGWSRLYTVSLDLIGESREILCYILKKSVFKTCRLRISFYGFLRALCFLPYFHKKVRHFRISVGFLNDASTVCRIYDTQRKVEFDGKVDDDFFVKILFQCTKIAQK